MPHALYLPENHAPGYAYPLVLHLHDDGRSEADLSRWFPQVSDQNFIGLGIRAPFPAPTGIPGAYRWNQRRPDASFATILDALAWIRRDWNVHPERIFLLGEGSGAVTALQHLVLQRTRLFEGEEQIAGVICTGLPGDWPHRLPAVPPGISGRVLFVETIRAAAEFAAIDALAETGLEVAFAGEFHRPLHTAVNHWLMSSVTGVIY
jgi:hypothetical protein